MVSRHPYLDHDGPIAFAHRGGATAAPENTLVAFQDAVNLGYVYVETDVHATSDGVLVAFHDNDLSRTCGVDKRISEVTWDDLRSVRVGGTEPIPLLEDILGTWPDLRVNIDCKSEGALRPLVETMQRLDCLDRVCIGSFSDSRMSRIREALGPGLCSSMPPREVAKILAVATMRLPAKSNWIARAAQVPVKQGPIPVVTSRLVEIAHRSGIQVHVWTIDDPVEMSRLLDMGVDGIMTDDTRALRDVLRARDAW